MCRTCTRTSIWIPSRWSTRLVEWACQIKNEAARLWRSFFGRSRDRVTKGTTGREEKKTVLGEGLKAFNRIAWLVLLVMIAGMGATTAAAQTPGGSAIKNDDVNNPVAQVRNQQSWEYGPFVNWGTGVGNRSDYKFLSAGFELGKVLTPVMHAGIFSGQFEFAGNIMPLWQAYTPPPHTQIITC